MVDGMFFPLMCTKLMFLIVFGYFCIYTNQNKRTTVVAGSSFSTSHLKPLIRFRSTANTVLNVHQRPSEQILMKMLYATCVPHLTYASDVVQYSAGHMQQLNVALNDCIRRVFTYNRWESVRFLRLSFGYPSLIEIFENRSRRFLKQLSTLGNSTLECLQKLNTQRISDSQ